MAATAAAFIEVLPLGAGQRVGRSAILATHGRTTVLLDCGADLAASADSAVLPDPRFFGSRPPCCVLLTHAHLDHVGALPALLPSLPKPCEILATEATRRAAALALEDASSRGRDGAGAGIAAAVRRIRSVRAGAPVVVAGGRVRATAVPVGHVIGACAWLVEFAAWGGPRAPASRTAAPLGPWPSHAARSAALGGVAAPSDAWPGTSASLLYTGDLGPWSEVALPGPQSLLCLPRPDVLVTENTYARVVRPPRGHAAAALAREVLRAVEAGGSALVACHALGRAQEAAAIVAAALASSPAALARARLVVGRSVLHDASGSPPTASSWAGPAVGASPLLARLRQAGASAAAPPLVHGHGLTSKVTSLYASLGAEAAPGFRAAMAALAAAAAAAALARPPGTAAAPPTSTVMITAPLGLGGGPGLELLWRCAGDPASALILTGRAPEGSPARAAQDGAAALMLRPPATSSGPSAPQLTRLRCSVVTCSLSAHADGDDVVALCRGIAPRAGVVLVHDGVPEPRGRDARERAAATSLRLDLQTALSVPVFDPPDHTAVAVPLALGLSTEPGRPAAAAAPGAGSEEARRALAAEWSGGTADRAAAVRAVLARVAGLASASPKDRAAARAAGLPV